MLSEIVDENEGIENINHANIHIPSWVELQIEFYIKFPTLHTLFSALHLSSQRCDTNRAASSLSYEIESNNVQLAGHTLKPGLTMGSG